MTAPNWFDISEEGSGIFTLREPGHVNAFLVCGQSRAALIDTGMGFAAIREAVASVTALPLTVLNTHWHFDHVGGNREFASAAIFEGERHLAALPLSNALLHALYLDPCRALGLSFPEGFLPETYEIVNPLPAPLPSNRIDLGGRSLTVLHTPGHTLGSTSFLDSLTGTLFCGDLIYEGTLYAHFTDSDPDAYCRSLDSLISMGASVSRIAAGHNSPLIAPDILSCARDLIQAALEGKTAPREEPGWSSPVLRHESGRLAVLTPMPGSPGVDLLRIPGNTA